MARNINTGRYIIPNQFKGLHRPLAIWNILNVASNLMEIAGESVALRYLEANLTEDRDEELAMQIAPLVQKGRHPFYGLRKGDCVIKDNIGVMYKSVGLV